jgi:hypothetical protein
LQPTFRFSHPRRALLAAVALKTLACRRVQRVNSHTVQWWGVGRRAQHAEVAARAKYTVRFVYLVASVASVQSMRAITGWYALRLVSSVRAQQ